MANSDNKVNMSLDDIIKTERKNKKGFAGNRRVVRNVKKGRMGAGKRDFGPARRGNRNDVRLNAATVRAVNRLVKRAVSQQTNQQLVQRAAFRRPRAQRIVAARPAGFRARRAFNRTKPALAGRLRGVSQRSRTIISNATRRAQQQEPLVLQSNVKPLRGRGSSRLGQLVSDEEPVFVRRRQIVPIIEEEEEEEEIVRPVPRRFRFPPKRQVVQRPRNDRTLFVQSRLVTRPVVVERRMFAPAVRNRGINKRFVSVSNARRFQPVYGRVEPVQRQGFRARRGGRRQQYVNPNAAQMREALGIGRPVTRVVERFEPSSSFLQRVPAGNRKGRGFKDRFG